tara:strand:+ start:501 stop:1022 length:522 start_codon:yes stop_codon:yes gene_type:complete
MLSVKDNKRGGIFYLVAGFWWCEIETVLSHLRTLYLLRDTQVGQKSHKRAKAIIGKFARADKAAKAADVARTIAGQPAPPSPSAMPEGVECETVSYNLPFELIDLVRDLAALRHEKDQAEKRALRRAIKAAKKAGQPAPIEPPAQSRKSASAVIREAIEANADNIRAEIESLS